MTCGAHVLTAVIASSHLIQGGMASLLAGTRFQMVQPSALCGEASDTADEQRPLTLILAMPEDSASQEAVRSLRAAHPEAKLVIFGRAAAADSLSQDLALAAQAVLDHGIRRETLITILDLVMSEMRVQSPGLSALMTQRRKTVHDVLAGPQPIMADQNTLGMQEGLNSGPVHRLTDRELDVLRCLADGASNKMIARKFALAEATVKVHVKAVLRKLGTQNRTQAAMWARDHGIMAAVASGLPPDRQNSAVPTPL
ncbi:helix-turn-helix transcriptional regulator [Methylobacterium nigriterrae]|uniref:helix-turn-helix transcriptional regulator n=1 Tax=Methylobacterium nigriterrae TaxID=3127512 RepID=UPI0030138B65